MPMEQCFEDIMHFDPVYSTITIGIYTCVFARIYFLKPFLPIPCTGPFGVHLLKFFKCTFDFPKLYFFQFLEHSEESANSGGGFMR